MPADIVELTTGDPHRAHQQLNQLYAPERPMKFSSDPGRFGFARRVAQGGGLHGGRVQHATAVRVERPPFDEFLAATVLSGEMSWCSGREHLLFRRGGVVLYPTTVGSSGSWADLTLGLVRIPMSAIEQAAHAHTGIDPADLRFHTLTPVSPAMARTRRGPGGVVHPPPPRVARWGPRWLRRCPAGGGPCPGSCTGCSAWTGRYWTAR